MRFGDDDASYERDRSGAKRIRALLAPRSRPELGKDMRKCPDCGFEFDYWAPPWASNGWRLHVPHDTRIGRPVCAGRYDETGELVSCYERLEREDSARQAEHAALIGRCVRDARKRGALSPDDRAILGPVRSRELEASFRTRKGGEGHEP